MKYYYYKGDEKIGPVDDDELRVLAEWGEITPETTIEREDGSRVPASQVVVSKFGPKYLHLSLKTWCRIAQIFEWTKILAVLVTLSLCVISFFHLDDENAWCYVALTVFAGIFFCSSASLQRYINLGRSPKKAKATFLRKTQLLSKT